MKADVILRFESGYSGMAFRYKKAELEGKTVAAIMGNGDTYRVQLEWETGIGSGGPDEARYSLGEKIGVGLASIGGEPKKNFRKKPRSPEGPEI